MSTQLLPAAGQRFLLEAGLDVLHQQSEEWLMDIEFWRDEIAFYHHLVERLDVPGISSVSRRELANMEKELLHINSEELEDLRRDVYDHERFLSAVLSGKERSNELEYRNRHARLAQHVRDFNFRFVELKRYIFRLVKRMHPFEMHSYEGRRA